ncbi:MAG TPA: HNH endonuclease signature motif containing protein [Terriglobales bacterium]|nr:HNH endonuclease signature motif containing protein [Terriglobales bacterium]
MAWVLFDTRLPWAPEMLHVGPECFGYYLAAFAHCARHRVTDGTFRPTDPFGEMLSPQKAAAICRKMADGGLLRPRARGRYAIVGFPYGVRGMVRIQWERPKLSRAYRRSILVRDKVCQYCGSTERLQVDHIFPVARGGGDGPENLQALCFPCNIKKRDKLPHEMA